MARRTSPDRVAEIVKTDPDYDLSPFIEIATSLVDHVDSCDTGNTLDATRLEIIERLLSAHFYSHQDQLFTSKKTGGASGVFQGKTDMYLESTQYGQSAIILDTTGCLSRLNQQGKNGKLTGSITWLGKTYPDNQEETNL